MNYSYRANEICFHTKKIKKKGVQNSHLFIYCNNYDNITMIFGKNRKLVIVLISILLANA